MSTKRLLHTIETLAQITAAKPGVTRFSYTHIEKEAKRYLKTEAEQSGLMTDEDQVGNLFFRSKTHDQNKSTYVIGSHIDTVPSGGKYDGALGVLIGLEILRQYEEEGIQLPFNLEVIAFTDEEGARFKTGMIGSRAWTGKLKEADLLFKDEADIALSDAMKQAGYNPNQYKDAAAEWEKYLGYLEVHIEQAKTLERLNQPLGIVSGIYGLKWLEITVKGEANHAGATPMNERKDALIEASRLMIHLNEAVSQIDHVVMTFGQIEAKPGGFNVIPGEVTFSVDLRALSEERIQQLTSLILEKKQTIEETSGVSIEVNTIDTAAPVLMDEALSNTLVKACEAFDLAPPTLPSGAGHDAMHVAAHIPTAMLFVRTVSGLSHHPDEAVTDEDVVMALRTIKKTIDLLAEG